MVLKGDTQVCLDILMLLLLKEDSALQHLSAPRHDLHGQKMYLNANLSHTWVGRGGPVLHTPYASNLPL